MLTTSRKNIWSCERANSRPSSLLFYHAIVVRQLLVLLACFACTGDPVFCRSQSDTAPATSPNSRRNAPDDPSRQINEQINTIQSLISKQDYSAATPIARSALALAEARFGKEDPKNIELLNYLGWLLMHSNSLPEARKMFDRAIAVAEKNGLQDQAYASSLNNMATWLYMQGDYHSAMPLFQKAIAVTTQAYGPEDPTLASILKNYAGLLDAANRGDEAIAAYQKSIGIFRKRPGTAEGVELAQALTNLGTSLTDKGNYDAALPVLEEALQIKRKLLGDEHAEIADSLNNLAMLYMDLNKLDEAKPLFEQALTIQEKLFGPEHVSLVPELNNLGDLYQLRKDSQSAAKHYLRAAGIIDSYVRHVLPSLSFAEQQAALSGQCREEISRLLTVCREGRQLSSAYGLFFQWKGMLVESLAREAQIRRSNPSPELRAKLEELAKLRAELAGWYLEAGNVAFGTWKEKNDRLTQRKEALEREIVEANPLLQTEVGELTLQKFAAALKEDEAIIDIYRHNYFKDSFDDNAHYSAIITSGGTQTLVDLQSALALEEALNRWRQDVLSMDMAEDSWQSLSETLLPVYAKLPANVKKVWICPDGELARIPWQLISVNPNKSPSWLSCQIDSARELAVLRAHSGKPNLPEVLLVTGGIDFNAGVTQASKPLIVMPPLPGTLKEAKDIAVIGKSANLQLMELSGADANKSNLLASLPKANYIHLATHGFFFDENTINAIRPDSRAVAIKARTSPLAETAQRNPLVESGIALAGANRGASGKSAENEGFLTAEEFVVVDLSKCKLITLSACDTGRGKEITGQGVMGLRSSIMAAGANTVLMSLWKIPDVPTVELMKLFYTNLWTKKMAPAEALRSAQQTLTSTWTDEQRAPINWAGWVLVGAGW